MTAVHIPAPFLPGNPREATKFLTDVLQRKTSTLAIRQEDGVCVISDPARCHELSDLIGRCRDSAARLLHQLNYKQWIDGTNDIHYPELRVAVNNLIKK